MRRGEIFGLKTEHELHTVIVFQQGIFFWHEAFAPSGFLFLLLFYITRMFERIWQVRKHYPKWFLVFMRRFFYTVYYWSFHAGYFERILTISIFSFYIQECFKKFDRWRNSIQYCFLEEVRKTKIAFEIIWPLVKTNSFVRFLGKSSARKKLFEINWPLVKNWLGLWGWKTYQSCFYHIHKRTFIFQIPVPTHLV